MIIKIFITIIGCSILFSIINGSYFRIGACSVWLEDTTPPDVKDTTFEASRTKERIKASIAEMILSAFIFHLLIK